MRARWVVMAALALVGVVAAGDRAVAQVVGAGDVKQAYSGLMRPTVGVFVVGSSNNPDCHVAVWAQQNRLERNIWQQFDTRHSATYGAASIGKRRQIGCARWLPSKGFDGYIEGWGWAAICKSELSGGWGISCETHPKPRPLIFLHFVKLTLHDVQLAPKNNSGDNADYDQSQGEQTNSTRPARHNEIGLAGLFFAASASAVFIAFKSAEYADERRSPWWWVPFLCFLGLAFWLANHAVGLTL